MVAKNYTNEQYLKLVDVERKTYQTTRENSIFFEVDGPYRAMALPAAQQQGKGLKKR
jgi:DNA polymerase epsilon subunit 1